MDKTEFLLRLQSCVRYGNQLNRIGILEDVTVFGLFFIWNQIYRLFFFKSDSFFNQLSQNMILDFPGIFLNCTCFGSGVNFLFFFQFSMKHWKGKEERQTIWGGDFNPKPRTKHALNMFMRHFGFTDGTIKHSVWQKIAWKWGSLLWYTREN